VRDVRRDRLGPEEAVLLRALEDLDEIPVGIGTLLAQEASLTAAGIRTTRRRGSSPPDSVSTPSISATVSCTTLRSDADIGSSA
jgi:hypothetical protein